MSTTEVLETLIAAVVFCLAFLFPGFLRRITPVGERTAVSLAGGAAVAYVFVHLSPELQAAADEFRETTAHIDREGVRLGVNLATMLGFLTFYGLDRLILRSHEEGLRERPIVARLRSRHFALHILAFTSYAWIAGFLLIRQVHHEEVELGFYTIALALHFSSVGHGLKEEHGALYDRVGAWLLAGGCLAGWASGLLVGVDHPSVPLMLGLVGGGIIANTVIAELPTERKGRFGPFLLGALIYTTLLLLAR